MKTLLPGVLTLCLLAASSTDGQPAPVPPKAVIVGPSEVTPGDLVILDASQSVGSGYSWTLIPAGKTFLPVEGGTKVVFATGQAGKYTFVLAVAKGDKSAITTQVVTIGIPPAPEPTPIPPTPGPVPLPPGKYGLAQIAFDSLSLVTDTSKAANAKALAGNFSSMASAIAAGTAGSFRKILEDTTAMNKASLGASDSAWASWGKAIETKLQSLNASGQLTTPADLQVAWTEIATGLGALK